MKLEVENCNDNNNMPMISKIYCSNSQVVLGVRRRPHVASGGGFVVTDCSCQNIVFKVDGCGIHDTSHGDQLYLRDSSGHALLLIRQKGGLIEALSMYKKWKAYTFDYEGSKKLDFSLKEPNSCLVRNKNLIRISTEPRRSNKAWDFEVKGSFPDRQCSIIDSSGNAIAKIGVKKEINEVMATKDLYHVIVEAGVDQAFVIGVIAILDYIYGESTRC